MDSTLLFVWMTHVIVGTGINILYIYIYIYIYILRIPMMLHYCFEDGIEHLSSEIFSFHIFVSLFHTPRYHIYIYTSTLFFFRRQHKNDTSFELFTYAAGPPSPVVPTPAGSGLVTGTNKEHVSPGLESSGILILSFLLS